MDQERILEMLHDLNNNEIEQMRINKKESTESSMPIHQEEQSSFYDVDLR